MDTLIFHFLITPAADEFSDGSNGAANLQVRAEQQQPEGVGTWCWCQTWSETPVMFKTTVWGSGSMLRHLHLYPRQQGRCNIGPVLVSPP